MIPVPVVLAAYRSGLFPMPGPSGAIAWYAPDPRAIIPLDRFHVSRRLARVLRSGRFTVTFDRAFDDVIAGCASRGADTDWINAEIIESYSALHSAGFAHSVEAWCGDRLVGGLYGVALRGAFFGESMFHHVTDASKAALAVLVERLRARDFQLLDIQWLTPHLARFGGIDVPRDQYLALLEEALKVDTGFGG
ncbi:MAG: leucyl/phenylalanyl-tRNA--protein transferase [Vicinamibacterales bacterium]|jgi:leucyl/phenylalanyl-tRNA--protein transferase|nr:leucyl/phenylalanyl-tRNA--protein transferase [Acidobacteriota bacterium]MDP7295297.1 leucyl/phenylalanyl-tRNA--protein transferase [Vicinamibacterales bacterium]MDP7471208.1 leucyl/phenylalanyl-tRNA--protein transferase [Vicinamibacterales bacterium]MDP7670482.1 leucyl/phenylalanyl-tRNA--protein transferase [Vicinamibacterales bacterium]HJO38140.1 leucyl/phenylalanyl-tRNA--protein transferase [Vicinamibacterales bacterium]|tara:strand:- start:244 stop:822 length:579 start_codon:yes stop_codon:yes gene_type:complete